GAGAWQLGVWHELDDLRNPVLQDDDVVRGSPLLRPEEPRGIAEGRANVAEDGRRGDKLAEDLPEPCPAVHRRTPTQSEEERTRAVTQHGEHELPEPAARGDERVALTGGEERQPDRRGRFDDRATSGKEQPM